jgi:hypothetical protein
MDQPNKQTPAVDRDPRDRPGVPMIPDLPSPAPSATAMVMHQKADVPVLVSVDVGELTPVFSTAVPPRGLSGALKRRAYAIPEHFARRWLLLLVSDRVDVWENRLRRHPFITGGVAAAVFATMAVAGRRR